MLNFSFLCCLEGVVLWLETTTKVSMKLMASLAPARAEVEAGIVGLWLRLTNIFRHRAKYRLAWIMLALSKYFP